MSALPAAITERDARDAVARLAAIQPGNHWVVSCYLKLEPRDRTRGKYLIKSGERIGLPVALTLTPTEQLLYDTDQAFRRPHLAVS